MCRVRLVGLRDPFSVVRSLVRSLVVVCSTFYLVVVCSTFYLVVVCSTFYLVVVSSIMCCVRQGASPESFSVLCSLVRSLVVVSSTFYLVVVCSTFYLVVVSSTFYLVVVSSTFYLVVVSRPQGELWMGPLETQGPGPETGARGP